MYIQPNSVRVGCNLTLSDKVSPQLMKLCFNIVDLAEGAKWLVNMLSAFVLLCGFKSRREEKEKLSIKILTLTLNIKI